MSNLDRWKWSSYEYADRSGDFDFKKLFAFPGPLGNFDARGPRRTVCIVGGGIAGLTAAYELAKLNFKVTVLEATGRWGGRIFTHYFSDGTYGEIGAMRIPLSHACTQHYVDEFALKTRTFVSSNIAGFLFFRGVKTRKSQWQPIALAYGRMPGALKADVAFDRAAIAPYPLTPALEWEQFSNTLTDRQLLNRERKSLYEGVCGNAAPARLSAQDWEYVGKVTQAIWGERFSLLHNVREFNLLTQTRKCEIKDGMSVLTRAFVKALLSMPNVTLHIGEKVSRVEIQPSGILLVTSQSMGSPPREEKFDYVVCTAPAPAAARIDFGAAMLPAKLEAMRGLSYMAAAKTLMRCRERHWETVDHIYGGSSTTDLPIQQCWYPSDNSKAVPPDSSDHGVSGIGFSAAPLIDESQEPSEWESVRDEVSKSPGVFLAAYMWESNARRFAALSEAERSEIAISNVAALHPDNEKLLEDIVHHSWDVGGGAFASFAPGEQSRYQAALCEPLFDGDGQPKVFFAGEHLAIMHGWIQGAIQSALAAVIKIIARK
jgi:monoamine oxidase